METVRLTDKACDLAAWIARQRQHNKRRHGARDQKVDQRASLDLDLEGAKGEMALAQFLGVLPANVPAGPGYPPHHLEVGGLLLQTKYTRHRAGSLIVKSLAHFDVDVMVLVTAGRKPGTVDLIGWISREEFAAKHQVKSFGGNNPVPYVPAWSLRPMAALADWLGVQIRTTTAPVPAQLALW